MSLRLWGCRRHEALDDADFASDGVAGLNDDLSAVGIDADLLACVVGDTEPDRPEESVRTSQE